MARKNVEDRGDQLVKQQIISKEDLDEARKREAESGTPWYRQLLQAKKLSFDVVNDVLHYEFHPKALRESHTTLGDALVELKAITKGELKSALAEQRRNGKLLGEVLLDNEYVTREAVALALSRQYNLNYTDLSETPSEIAALECVPESMAKQREIIPVKLEGDKLTVLISGPQSINRLKDVGILLGVRILPLVTATENIVAEIEARYGGQSTTRKSVTIRHETPSIEKTKSRGDGTTVAKSEKIYTKEAKRKAKEISKKKASSKAPDKETIEVAKKADSGDTKHLSRFDEIAQEAQGVPVVKLVSTIIVGAVNSGATDVHLDPQEPEMRVRYRIDGVLHDVMSIPPDIESAVVSRMKILADIDITETRHPQDGHIQMEVGDSNFDIRVATLPTYLGERIVLRLLDQSSVLQGIRDLGLEKEDEKSLLNAIEQPYGMILVTGPTGSGKTTTLYSCLNQIDIMTDSIVTLEDPVEYQLSGINQVQIEPEIDLTFAEVLRAALRQDIDVLLVGEIRDPETARIAIRAAMTGHLVFSTLHTNDAPEAITTLRNMDIPPYLISSALTAIIAQRLVRKICSECKKAFTPARTLTKSLNLPDSVKRLYRGEGCDTCYHTGTHGRTGIFEMIEITPVIRRMIAANEPADKIAKTAKLKTMAQRCRTKVKEGVLAPEEFLRVIRT